MYFDFEASFSICFFEFLNSKDHPLLKACPSYQGSVRIENPLSKFSIIIEEWFRNVIVSEDFIYPLPIFGWIYSAIRDNRQRNVTGKSALNETTLSESDAIIFFICTPIRVWAISPGALPINVPSKNIL